MWARIDDPDIGRGRWRVLWLGNMKRPEHAASDLEVNVFFIEDAPAGKRPRIKPLYRNIEEIGLYGVQSRWLDGRCIGYDDKREPLQTLTVIPKSARYAVTYDVTRRNPPDPPPPPRAFTDDEYSLHGWRTTAGCWLVSTTEGIDLVVPGWQVLQAFYLFDPLVVPAVLAGMLDVDADYGTSVPWLPGTQCADGQVTYHLAPGVTEPVAKAFARLLFDPYARTQAMMFWKRSLEPKRKHLPLIHPPHREPAPWTFRGRRLKSKEGRERWLLLYLHRAVVPLPFTSFQTVKRGRKQKGGVQDQPPTLLHQGPQLPDQDTEVSLVSDRGGRGSGRRIGTFKGLRFIDATAEAMPVSVLRELEEEEEPRLASLVLPDPNQVLEGISMATQGFQDAAVLAARPAGFSKPAEDPRKLFARTRAAFEAIIEYVRTQSYPVPWSARLITTEGSDCFERRSPELHRFLILELRVGTTYTYALDALRSDEEFPLVMVRQNSADAMDPAHFHVWLRGFPWKGSSAWFHKNRLPHWLQRPIHIRHQTTELPADIRALPENEREAAGERHIVGRLRDRILKHLLQFEGHQARANVKRRVSNRRRP